MKTRLLPYAILFAALLPGCSQETPSASPSEGAASGTWSESETSPRRPIRFVTAGGTKAVSEVTAASLQESGFNVCCVAGADDTDFQALSQYFNEAVSYDAQAGTFGTASPYYFPEDDGMLFFAANADLDIYFKHPNWPAGATFEVSGPWERDVVTATASFDPASDSRSAVSLAFSHRLAQMSVSAKGAVSGVSYEVTSVSINTSAWGRWYYIMASDPNDWRTDYWVCGDPLDHSHFSGAAACGTTDYTAVGTRYAYFPGTWTVTVNYTVKSGSFVLGTYAKTFDATLSEGRRTLYNLTLPYDDNDEIVYSVTVADWVDESYDVSL